jgi:hypothetical protein
METWRSIDHFEGRAHFCGNTHLGRYRGRRLNSAFLQYTHPETGDRTFGGYFVVEVSADLPFDVEMREIGTLDRYECARHGERGVQFHAAFEWCMYCAEPAILVREMAASAFYGLTQGSDRETVTEADLLDYAVDLWEDPPEGFRAEFGSYLADLEEDRYAPLARADGDGVTLAEESYAY